MDCQTIASTVVQQTQLALIKILAFTSIRMSKESCTTHQHQLIPMLKLLQHFVTSKELLTQKCQQVMVTKRSPQAAAPKEVKILLERSDFPADGSTTHLTHPTRMQ
jgi:hypothetical protein